MTTPQKAFLALILTIAIGSGIYQARQNYHLREQVQRLQQQHDPLIEQIAQFKSENENLSNQLSRLSQSHSSNNERLRELLRLRGELAMSRRRQHELEQAVAAGRPTSEAPVQSASGASQQPPSPSPFQMQLVLDNPGEDTESLTNRVRGFEGETLHVQKTPLLDATAIRSVAVTKNESDAPEIDVEFSPEGQELFAAITKENINKRLAIVLNGQLYSAPVIRSEISAGKAQITGNFTEEEARELAAKIKDAIASQ